MPLGHRQCLAAGGIPEPNRAVASTTGKQRIVGRYCQRFDQPVVSFRFNTKGAERFAKLTRDNVGRPFAIILDEKVVSYPRINEPILGGSGQISGNFSTQETNDLAVVLRSGALPAKLTVPMIVFFLPVLFAVIIGMTVSAKPVK